jgi:hypothetical protein
MMLASTAARRSVEKSKIVVEHNNRGVTLGENAELLFYVLTEVGIEGTASYYPLLSRWERYGRREGIGLIWGVDVTEGCLHEYAVPGTVLIELFAEEIVLLALQLSLVDRGSALGIELHHKHSVSADTRSLLFYYILDDLVDMLGVKRHYR